MSFLAPMPRSVNAYDLVMPLVTGAVAYERTEAAAFAYCDGQGRLRGMRHVRSSLADAVDLSIRQIVKDALACDARRVVMAHNHPSGDMRPSHADRDATRRIAAVLRALDIRLHDHVIVTPTGRWSFREAGLL